MPTAAGKFVGELLIRRRRDIGITADSAEAQTLQTELAAKQAELKKALKPRAVAQKMAARRGRSGRRRRCRRDCEETRGVPLKLRG